MAPHLGHARLGVDPFHAVALANRAIDDVRVEPNYWGQMALRNCLRQAYNGGGVLAGRCTSSSGTNSLCEPNMNFARRVTVPWVMGQTYT